MGCFSPAEIITTSFYAWEVRGRGWQLADYPVALEPPFRPFFLLPGLMPEVTVIDDGKRPTFLSSFIEGVKKTWSPPAIVPSAPPSVPDFEEPYPAEAPPSEPLVAYRLTIPRSYNGKPEITLRLLSALSARSGPLSFELVGHNHEVALQFVCRESDQEHLAGQLLAYVPDASLVETADLLIRDGGHREAVSIDIGLSHEFFLPVQIGTAFHIDPYLALIPALAAAGEGEKVAVQVLFERAWNPWAKAVLDALDDGTGGCLFADAPELLPQAREKLKSPLFAVSLRMYAEAENHDRAWDLAKGTQAFLLQFARPGSNELIPMSNAGYDDDLHTAAIFRRESYRLGMLLSADELAGFVHLPDASVRHPGFLREERTTRPCPVDALNNAFVLGKNIDRGHVAVVTLSEEERLQHLWVIGASGSGKSTLLEHLILQDVRAGTGCAVLDPHGDLIEDVLARLPHHAADNVVVFDPSDSACPVGFNILSAGSDIERTLLASDLVGIFRRLATSWGDTMSTVLGNAVLAILESPKGGTLIDLRRFLVEDRFRKDYLESVEDEEIRFFWQREYPLIGSRAIGPILTRLDTFLRSKLIRHVVGQKEAKLDLGAVMAGRKFFFAKLSQGLIGEENAYLLGSLLVSKFHQLALARQAQAKAARVPFFLYADEFQHFATPSMESLLTGARKYRLGLVLAHQTLAQLDDSPKITSALFGSAYTRAVFRVGENDARRLAEGFVHFEANDLTRLKQGEALVRLGSADRDFNLSTFPPTSVTEHEANARHEMFRQISRERYGIPVEVLRTTLRLAYGSAERQSDDLIKESTDNQPETGHAPTPTERKTSADMPAEPIVVPARRKVSLARIDQPAVPGRGGSEHKYLQHLIKRLGEERGFRALIEEAAGPGRADVVLRKDAFSIACEISITTDVEHELENLKKCEAAGFSHLIAIVPDKRRREKLRQRAEEVITTALHVIGPDDVVGTLDGFAIPMTTETSIRGYKVKVTRQAVTPEDVSGRRAAVAQVIARSLRKGVR